MDLSAATIYSLHCPSICELRPWLLAHGEPQAEPGAYQQVLVRLGQRHEASHLAELGDVTDLSEGTFEERIDRTRKLIELGEHILYQPVFQSTIQIEGAVLVQRSLRRARLRVSPCHSGCYDSLQQIWRRYG